MTNVANDDDHVRRIHASAREFLAGKTVVMLIVHRHLPRIRIPQDPEKLRGLAEAIVSSRLSNRVVAFDGATYLCNFFEGYDGQGNRVKILVCRTETPNPTPAR